MKHQRGSALIIAVFIISAVGSVALGIGRLIYLQIGSANAYEKGVYAYYAAESGIEEGFLRYRYDQEATLPSGTSFEYDNSNVFRNNLTTSSLISTGINKNGIPASDAVNQIFDQVYDLRMNPKVAFIGEDSTTAITPSQEISRSDYSANTEEYVIKRDESKKLNIDLNRIGRYDLYFKAVPGSTAGRATFTSDECFVLEIKIIANNSYTTSGGVNVYPLQEKKKLFYNPKSVCNYGSAFSKISTDTAPYGTGTTAYSTLNDLKTQIWGAENISTDSEIFIKPIGSSITFLISPYPETTPGEIGMTGTSNILTSTGYYMGIRRGLEVNIDRQSGSLYDLFDYVLYKAE